MSAKCQFPYYKVRKIIAWSGTFYSGLVLTNLDETKMLDYYDELKETNNAERNFAWWTEKDPNWNPYGIYPFKKCDGKYDLTKPNPLYYEQLFRRLDMVKQRDLTEIISLIDFSGSVNPQNWPSNPWNRKNNVNNTAMLPSRLLAHEPSIQAFLRYLTVFTKKTLPYKRWLIIELGNEVGGDYFHLYNWYRRGIKKLIELGIPKWRIQINWFDSSYFWQLIYFDFPGILSAIHCEGSPKSISEMHSGSSQKLVENGMYGSSDGPDWNGQSKGLLGKGWPEAYRKPSPGQLRPMVKQTLKKGSKGFEHLSAACVVNSYIPDLDDAINIGKSEREALYRAWNIFNS
jgi:hypothetical protein